MTHLLDRLTLEESARINKLLLDKGYILVLWENYQEALRELYKPLPVTPAANLRFPWMEPKAETATIRFYKTMEEKGYPYYATKSQNEKNVEALVSFYMMTAAEKWGDTTHVRPLTKNEQKAYSRSEFAAA